MFNKIEPASALFQAPTFEYQALSSATSLKSARKRFEKRPGDDKPGAWVNNKNLIFKELQRGNNTQSFNAYFEEIINDPPEHLDPVNHE